MKVFEFQSYKEFVLARIQSMPKKGRGEMIRIAEHLRMHSTRLSQILRGDTHLTLEQACTMAERLGLSETETEYFLLLVQWERAGTENLRKTLARQLAKLRAKAGDLSHLLASDKTLSESDRAIFYSSWHYSAVRLLTSISKYSSLDSIAAYLDLPKARVQTILEFLLSKGLCEERNGKLSIGPERTHLEASSLLVNRHRANWRIKSIQAHEQLTERDLVFTAPMSIGIQEQKIIRDSIVELIEKVQKLAVKSDAEKLVCLNIDWFEF